MNRRQLLQGAGAVAWLTPQSAQGQAAEAAAPGLALYPQSNPYRQVIALDGFWDFLPDAADAGRAQNWANGIRGSRAIAVPASWNEQFEDLRNFLGAAWYQTRFDVPLAFSQNSRVRLRFGSVNYLAEVWLNGQRLGEHEGGHLPFEFEVTGKLLREDNVLVVRVDAQLAKDRVPPGGTDGPAAWNEQYPAASFDFFPYAGIQRPVLLYSIPAEAIADVTVHTAIEGAEGRVKVRVDLTHQSRGTVRLALSGQGSAVAVEAAIVDGSAEGELRVSNAALWSLGAPHLYRLKVELIRGGQVTDRYSLPVGLRTIEVRDGSLLLNGKAVYLKGFGRHEDFPVVGRGLAPAVVVKDYSLMEWVGANSFRTSHYPYSEQMLDMADRLGILVIAETPAVGLYFEPEGLERRRQLCRQYTSELIARDKNRPSVVMWSLANEPRSRRAEAKPFFRELYDLARQMDSSRPVTVVSDIGAGEEAFEFLDVVCLNRYRGWYDFPGRIEEGVAALSAELDQIHAKFGKPVLMAEFGADAVAGSHSQPPVMFSEEYQSEMIRQYHELFRTKPYMIGEHVWNLCDFRTGESVRRVGALNLKGVFTRDRQPKLAAHTLRELWSGR